MIERRNFFPSGAFRNDQFQSTARKSASFVFFLCGRDLRADFPQNFCKTGGIICGFLNISVELYVVTSEKSTTSLSFHKTHGFSGKCCGYLEVISRLSHSYIAVILKFAENRIADNHKPARKQQLKGNTAQSTINYRCREGFDWNGILNKAGILVLVVFHK